jgi:hypothetical protein
MGRFKVVMLPTEKANCTEMVFWYDDGSKKGKLSFEKNKNK